MKVDSCQMASQKCFGRKEKLRPQQTNERGMVFTNTKKMARGRNEFQLVVARVGFIGPTLASQTTPHAPIPRPAYK